MELKLNFVKYSGQDISREFWGNTCICIRVALSHGNGGKMKVTNLTVPPFEVVSIIIKRTCAKYFDDCIIFKGVPQALKFNIENAMACITPQVYFREISFSSWNNMVDKGHGMQ